MIKTIFWGGMEEMTLIFVFTTETIPAIEFLFIINDISLTVV